MFLHHFDQIWYYFTTSHMLQWILIFEYFFSQSSSTSFDLKLPETGAAPSIHTSSSNPNLLTNHEAERLRPTSMPEHWLTGGGGVLSSEGLNNEMKVRQDFLGVAKTGLYRNYTCNVLLVIR